MKTSLLAIPLAIASCCSLVACSNTTSTTNQPASNSVSAIAVSSTDSQLTQFLEKEWQRFISQNPEMASYYRLGDDTLHAQWSDLSLDAINQRHTDDQNALAELLAINKASLSKAQQLNFDLFRWQLEMAIDEHQYQSYLMQVNQRGGVQTLDNFANYVPLDTVADYERWLKRLEALPTVIEQTTVLMQLGIDTGVLPPRKTLSRVSGQLEKQLVENAEESLFYKAFKQLPEAFSEQDKQRLQNHAKTVIADQVIPAYTAFTDFFNQSYLPACRDTDGLSEIPKGREYYEHLVKYYTTTDLTPDAIHQIGLQEVAKNRAAMLEIMKEVGFDGSFDQFITFLRTDPQFYYDTPEALFDAYLAVSKRLDPELVKLFGKLPRMPYGLKAIPDAIAPDTTTAYYQPPSADGLRAGYYFVNLHEPGTRPKYEMEVLSVHEAVPGHHLQIALQMELGELPMFRRLQGFTVFIEGWGLYSERLGYEMGLYQDPYSRFGQLTYDMWRAVRLVVDTGIHYKGWSRQQAIDYFTQNAAKSKEDIINEIDRYITMPGQALAYKIGQLKLLALRDQAENALGDKFDIRAFHDVVLGSGSIPLNVLEANVQEWIDKQLK
ncbi:DUF885 domain-containing protein [Aestuariibacter sp. GS-14]|uniref:DUF885 domain-containing protein n=1 Tax=Aestuariibacter sp. GS-14 TaxID=2590670 RepID=UPI0011262887|nr:DUF885 domain-containing protein [Aestuariibacter sp. GS-14]TPV62002.1 DUF885 domain-containing protein [Aestuariibacter sp. GS-14]